ncbi:hypothetical protein [Arthrobacter oryzae]|uniref:hypothetical protein n=1 Tax=Arthrobacter oryzae TaxID=409290 RepID=UPI00277E512C|nr:hypothetical protein [Arthrobacter oryzae]MDQ0078692.1 hypothetical protein [Arthrobacter oryzae]
MRELNLIRADAHHRSKKSATPERVRHRGEASSSTAGIRHAIRATAPGATCTAVGNYVGTNTMTPAARLKV